MTMDARKKGFTMIETIFGVAIFIVIMIAVTLFSRNTWIFNSFIGASLNNVDNVRLALKTFSSEIRTASTADTGAYVINQASSTSFTFYANIDSDVLKERVRYFLLNGQLQKGVIKPTGSPLSYNPANEQITTLISNVTNPSTFSYYDKNYDGTTAPLPAPIDIASIRLVKVTITIEKDPNKAPVTASFTTQVSIRNLKDNL